MSDEMIENGEFTGVDRRVCVHHSGVDTRLMIFNWLLGFLITAIIGSTGTIAYLLSDVSKNMAAINIKFAELHSDKRLNDQIHDRIAERISELERRDRERKL